MTEAFTESILKQAIIALLETFGDTILFWPEIYHDIPAADRNFWRFV